MTYKRVAVTSKLEKGIAAGADSAIIYYNLCTSSKSKSKNGKEN
jgi:hypothetical protein